MKQTKFRLMLSYQDNSIFCDSVSENFETILKRIEKLENTDKTIKPFTIVKGSKIHYKKIV
jgi:hypothetical protein